MNYRVIPLVALGIATLWSGGTAYAGGSSASIEEVSRDRNSITFEVQGTDLAIRNYYEKGFNLTSP